MRYALLLLLVAGCRRPTPEPAPLQPAPAPEPEVQPVAEEPRLADYAYRVAVSRSPGGMACWPCFLRARNALRPVRGVVSVTAHPYDGLIVIRHRADEFTGAAAFEWPLRKALPDVEIEPVGEPPHISQRVRMTKQATREVQAILDRATAQRPLVVIKLTARACAACTHDEPAWGDRVVRADIDVDATPTVKPLLAPQGVPEWVALDSRGEELGRWRGFIDPTTFEELIARLVTRASP